jgi:SAM-dependent MidA family methyltransferase
MTYDPELRRETPLALKLKARIERDGPIPLHDYMQACLSDPEFGYYVKKPALGSVGDFITAPEISQIFGELIGLWCAVVWQSMGSPKEINLVELGPGRGTLMSDALRATRAVAGFHKALRPTLIETSAPLREAQQSLLRQEDVPISWITQAEDIPCGPTIVIANEFLDTCPVTQIMTGGAHWHERTVELDSAGRLAFGRRPGEPPEHFAFKLFSEMRPDTVIEKQDFSFYGSLPSPEHEPYAALFIDYGHGPFTPGDTLQAIRAHRAEHPLTSPGEADLTVQVCFDDFIVVAMAASMLVSDPEEGPRQPHVSEGPITQAEFLGRLGVVERASRLMSANPARAAEIEAAVARLIAPSGMGTRFKAVGLRSPSLPQLPGFA